MTDSEALARIHAYLEEHQATYDRAALRRQLLRSGHDPVLVDQALWDVFGGERASVGGSTGGIWTMGSVLVHGVLVAALLGVLTGRASSFGLSTFGIGLVIIVVGPLVLLAEGRLLRAFSAADSSRRAVAAGAVLGAALFPVIFFGTCAVFGGAAGALR